MHENSDAELEDLKHAVDLVAFMAGYGYQEDRKDGGRTGWCMRRADGDGKVLVTLGHEGYHIYADQRDTANKGTIIDFVQHEHRCSLGEVRKVLRQWCGGARVHDIPARQTARITDQKGDAQARQRLLALWEREHRAFRCSTYLVSRGISQATQEAFRDAFAVGRATGDTLFAYHDTEGLCGIEVRSATKKVFITGSRKGLAFTKGIGTTQIILTESVIDAMSYAQLFGYSGKQFISLGGSCSKGQQDLLIRMLHKAARASKAVITATDADDAGDGYHAMLLAMRSVQGLSVQVDRHRPDCKDWNDQLLTSKK